MSKPQQTAISLITLGVVLAVVGAAHAGPADAQQVATPAVTQATNASSPGLVATAVPTEALASDEQEVTFQSGQDTLYGTLLLPNHTGSGKLPAALLLSGSGPTDRDGNSKLLPGKIDSHKFFARTLADAGIASLRYDKLGTGKTGLLGYGTHPQDIGFDIYVQEATAAFNYLKSRPEIDPSRILILGHSEGGLIALVVAQQLKTAGPKGLILAAPIAVPYLTLTRNQIVAQLDTAVKAGAVTPAQSQAILAELDAIDAQLLKEGTLPAKINPSLNVLFAPANAKFLAQAGQYDPRQIAATLPLTMPVLLLCGEKDVQVLCPDVQALTDSFTKAGNENSEFHAIPNMIHVFRIVTGAPKGVADYIDPTKPFSTDAAQFIQTFAKSALAP